MKAIKDMEMPGKPMPEGEEEEFDFGFEGEEGEESAESLDLSTISDDDLVKEMKKRGFEIEDEVEDEESEEPVVGGMEEPEEPIV